MEGGATLNQFALLAKASRLVAHDVWSGLRIYLGRIETTSGTQHSRLTLDESLAYIEDTVADYRTYGGFNAFYGRIVELGPGDSSGAALLMLADGAESVDLVDRFASHYDPKRRVEIYQHLARRHHFDCPPDQSWDSFPGLFWHIGQSAENFLRHAPWVSYDFVVSRAVLQHTYDPLAIIRESVRCLRPGVRSIHKVDLRDLGLFSHTGYELAWLQFPAVVWRAMTKNAGFPNRILAHRYRALLDEMRQTGNITYHLYVSRLIGHGEINPHQEYDQLDLGLRRTAEQYVDVGRDRFAPEFRQVHASDLAIAGCFLAIQKFA